MSYVQRVMDSLKEKYAYEPVFLQAVQEVLQSLQPVLDRLCEYGYLAVKPVPPSYGPGRKPSDTYLVNPAVWESADGEGRS